MTNWQERLRQEDERQHQKALRKPENPRALRKAELETVLGGIVSLLGIEGMLEGVRSEIWGMDSRVSLFLGDGDISLPGVVIKKGFILSYDYEYPVESKEYIVERKFGKYSAEGFWAGGGLSESSPRHYISTKTKIGWHEEQVGYNIKPFISKRSISMGVYVQGGTSIYELDRDVHPRVGFLEVPGHGDFALTSENRAKELIERTILQECLRRQGKKSLPADLLSASQARLVEIKNKMKQNPYKI